MMDEMFGNAGLSLLQAVDIREIQNNESEDNDVVDLELEKDLNKYKPEGANLKVYIDYDNKFIVLYPVLEVGDEKFYVDYDLYHKGFTKDKYKLSFNISMYLAIFRNILISHNIYQSKYFQKLLTMPAIYTDNVLEFLLEAVPILGKIATIYYTNNFKRILIRRKVNLNISLSTGNLERCLECSFEIDSSISPNEIWAMMEIIKDKEAIDELRYYLLKSGGFIDLRASKVEETLYFLNKFGITLQDLEKKNIKIPRQEIHYAIALIEEAKENNVAKIALGNDMKELENKLYNIKNVNLTIPNGLKAKLHPYQEDGFRWLKKHNCAGFCGILADDMGLGKTLQTIALILSILEEKGNIKVLIVVPTSLIDNWLSEFNRFAPSVKCISITGDVGNRSELFKDWKDYHVFISSYGIVLNDIKHYDNRVFDIMILDEAQKIKNHTAKISKEIKTIKANNKFALTGTPIENNLAELWSIFNWLMPTLLKEFGAFKKKYIDVSENMNELRERIRPFMLRRMKRDVLMDLPELTETILKIELSNEQKKLYLAYREQMLQMLENEDKIMNVLSKLTRLRQICCHPRMFMEDYLETTGKVEALLDIVAELKEEGRRVLVFSQFTSMLDIIKNELENNEISYCSLDGRTPQRARSKIVSDFNNGEATVFLISLKAGGTGLNLTIADTVVHFDPWWNPSVEEQASARAHRIGQKNCVQVIYLIAKGTIEEKINDVKQEKRELIEKVLESGEGDLSTMTYEDMKHLLL